MAFPLKRFHQSLFVFQFLIVSHSPPIHANVNGVVGHDHCLQISEWEVATKTTYNANVWYLSFFNKTLRGHLYKCCVSGHLLNTTHQHLRSFGEKTKTFRFRRYFGIQNPPPTWDDRSKGVLCTNAGNQRGSTNQSSSYANYGERNWKSLCLQFGTVEHVETPTTCYVKWMYVILTKKDMLP